MVNSTSVLIRYFGLAITFPEEQKFGLVWLDKTLPQPTQINVANAMAVECFKQGADAMIALWTDEYYYGLLRELSEESLQIPSKICEAFTEGETATINIFGPKYPEGLKKGAPSKVNAWGEGERKALFVSVSSYLLDCN